AQRVNQLPSLLRSTAPKEAPPPDVAPPEVPSAETSAPEAPQTDMSLSAERIAVVVNDGVISASDVRGRIALALLSAGLPDVPEVRSHLVPQVIRALVDEQLQMQEGKRLDITIPSEEIQKAMTRLAQDNHVPGGDMSAFLIAHNVSPTTLFNQIRAALTWNKVVQRELRPRVDIGDDEIESAIERMHANAGKQEYLVSEIYLAIDNPKDEEQVKTFAEGLVQQIKGGASFGAVARQFSQGTGASSGGDIGWIQIGQLGDDIDKVLQNMPAGEIAGPVRTTNGFHILGVREKRTIALSDIKEMNVTLQQAFRSFPPQGGRENILKEGERLRKAFTGCKDIPTQLSRDYPGWRWQDLGEVKLADAPSWLTQKVRDVAVGQTSEAMATDKGVLLLFVCNRKVPDNINRSEIMASIGTERLELLARRLLRDLRRNAYIDVRMTSAP
ncbi:MAG: hypothetical protein HGA90_02855, partial [Alphaproteobacteria bacterium]|nr:hypothetical protein [Alphaproteobacteria bacterium]